MKILNFKSYLLSYILSKYSSRDALLKLSKTTSPQKLFQSKCIKLYSRVSPQDYLSDLFFISLLSRFAGVRGTPPGPARPEQENRH